MRVGGESVGSCVTPLEGAVVPTGMGVAVGDKSKFVRGQLRCSSLVAT